MDFFQVVVMSVLLYGCTTWSLTKRIEKKLDRNNTRILRAIWILKSWKQYPMKQQQYGHLLPILKTLQVRGIRHVGHSWRSKDKLISNVLPRTPTHGRASVGWPARTYSHQLCADTGCSLEDLPGAMDDRDGLLKRERERVKEIRAVVSTWKWRCWWDFCYWVWLWEVFFFIL